MRKRWAHRRACTGVLTLGWMMACGTPQAATGDDTQTGIPSGSTSSNVGESTSADDGASNPDQAGDDADATTAAPSTSTTTSTTTSTNPSAEDDDTTVGNPVVFDVNVIPDAPALEQQGCGKVDFLFVIDNSGSMFDEQQQLVASFDGFITAIQASLEEQVDSYHVGVISSDNYDGNAPGCTTIGDLVTQTAGFGAANQVCTPFAQGMRFATEDDDLSQKFPCMAQIGSGGSPIEQPVTATIAALDPAKAGPGGCNEDFLRDDAILVVVIVTDDPPMGDLDDAHLSTDTTGWYDAVIGAKNGDPEAVVVLGFVPWQNTSCAGAPSPNLIGFIESFGEQGVLASVCEQDYGPIFADTVATIVTTCENFNPPG